MVPQVVRPPRPSPATWPRARTQIVLEYFELGGGAVARFGYERTADLRPDPPEPFAAEYFDNADLAGTPVLAAVDDAIDFDWGGGSPDSAVPANGFSAAGRGRSTTRRAPTGSASPATTGSGCWWTA